MTYHVLTLTYSDDPPYTVSLETDGTCLVTRGKQVIGSSKDTRTIRAILRLHEAQFVVFQGCYLPEEPVLLEPLTFKEVPNSRESDGHTLDDLISTGSWWSMYTRVSYSTETQSE